MEVKVDKKVPLTSGPDQGWALLSDIHAVAACMPGAQITKQIDTRRYKGTVTSRVGPTALRFSGDIEVLAIDAASREMQLLGKAADQAGSSASMNLTARIVPGDVPGESTLVGQATITVSGRLAQFGGRLIGPASEQILIQFGNNFRAAAADRKSQETGPESAPPAKELNAVSLVWAMVAGWFARLLGRLKR